MNKRRVETVIKHFLARVANAEIIRENLGPHLLKPLCKNRPENATKSWGCCYVASEALYYMGAKREGFKPAYIRLSGATHWFLKHPQTGVILDLTNDQFTELPDYSTAKVCGFLTSVPSKRAQMLIRACAAARRPR